jgi:hypothetical protein
MMMLFATRRRGGEYHSSEEDDKHLRLGQGMWEDRRHYRRHHRSHRKRWGVGLETNQEHRRRRSNPPERFLE